MRKGRLSLLYCATVMLIVGSSHGWASDSPLKLVISTVPGVRYSRDAMPIKVTFSNTSDKSVRILDVFQQREALPVFFRFEIKSANGTYVPIPGGGKIDLPKNYQRYAELAKGQKYRLTVNLSEYIKPEMRLKKGPYTVTLTYSNQYGDRCFQGQLTSNSIQMNLEK